MQKIKLRRSISLLAAPALLEYPSCLATFPKYLNCSGRSIIFSLIQKWAALGGNMTEAGKGLRWTITRICHATKLNWSCSNQKVSLSKSYQGVPDLKGKGLLICNIRKKPKKPIQKTFYFINVDITNIFYLTYHPETRGNFPAIKAVTLMVIYCLTTMTFLNWAKQGLNPRISCKQWVFTGLCKQSW